MSAKLIVAGDLCAAGRPAAGLTPDRAPSTWNAVAGVVQAADFSVVNLECPLTDHPNPILKSGPNLWAPAYCVEGIRAAGFTAVSLANNHILDAGITGLTDTMSSCRRAGLQTVGAGENLAAANTPLVARAADIRLAVLAIAENEFSTASTDEAGAWPFDLIDNARQIALAREDNDLVLVLLHGGAENYPLPSPQLQKTCRFFVEQGADAVVCHHSHVVGANEFYLDKPIVYGTGNLLFDCYGVDSEAWYIGCLVSLWIELGGTTKLELIPYRQDPAEPKVSLLVDDEREAVLSHVCTLNEELEDRELLLARWDAFCRTRKSSVLGSVLCLTEPELRLFDRGLLPSARLRLSPSRVARLSNLFTCESHSETCRQVLQSLLKETQKDTRNGR